MKFSIINEEGQILLLEREHVGEKMWKALQEVDGQLFAKYWCFATNILRDDLQQQNAFDCAVFFCCFARSLVLQSPVPDNSSIHNFSVVDSFWHNFPFSPHPIRSPVLNYSSCLVLSGTILDTIESSCLCFSVLTWYLILVLLLCFRSSSLFFVLF